MAFVKKTWLARLGQGLNKFILNGGSRVTLESSPDTVTQQGTPLSAENMNDLEQRIADEFSNQTDAINAISNITSGTATLSNTVVKTEGRSKVTWVKKNGFVVLEIYIQGITSTGGSKSIASNIPINKSGNYVIMPFFFDQQTTYAGNFYIENNGTTLKANVVNTSDNAWFLATIVYLSD